jgi:hypothetical protein
MNVLIIMRFAFLLSFSSVFALYADLTQPLSGTTYSNPIGSDFVSINIEWSSILEAFGMPNSDFVVNLVLSLCQAMGGGNNAPIIRIGGNSATKMYWSGSKLPRLEQQERMISKNDLMLLQSLAEKTGVKFTFTLPMLSSDPAYAMEILQNGIMQYIAPVYIYSIELGNEPDHYVQYGRRPLTYTYDDYISEFNSILAATMRVDSNFLIQGPAWAYDWNPYLVDYANKFKGVKEISFHKYGLRGCAAKLNPGIYTPYTLLKEPQVDEYKWISDVLNQISGNGQSIVWGEGGSASCNGTADVSDVYVSALWTLDVLFEYAWRNVKRATLSGSPTTLYAPFHQVNGVFTVNPTYYGMLMMNRILRGSNAQVFKVALDNSWATFSSDVIKTWGVKRDNEMTFVAIHKDPLQGSVSISVKAPTLSGCNNQTGFVTRMTGSSLDSQTGVTLAGQTFDNSGDGRPLGNFVEEIVHASDNLYTINVDQYTVVSLRIGCKAGPLSYEPVPTPQSPPNKTPASTSFFTPAIIAVIVIGGVIVLIVTVCLILRNYGKKAPQLIDPENHPHPFAKNNQFLYINGNSRR